MKKQWLGYTLFFAAGIATATLFDVFWAGEQKHNGQNTRVMASAPQRPVSDPDRSKPWGHLEALEIPFADPDELAPDRALRMKPPRWFFENFSQDQVIQFLTSCDLTETQRSALLRQSEWTVAPNGLWVSPSLPLTRALTSAAREKIYSVLARSSENYVQRFPFRFPLGEIDSHFSRCELSHEKLSILKSLTYTNCGTLCFASLNLLPDLYAPEEIDCVVDCLYRIPAYRLRLRIYPDSDVNGLVRYYGKGGREKRIKPLIESLTKVQTTNNNGGATINIAGFFAPFALLRLNTFPNAWKEAQASKEDCFWTSMNFFNAEPDPRFLDAKYVRQVLHSEYAPIQDEPTFGDLVTLVNEAGDGMHMCVYIADNFVFTKNGMNQLAPWVLMKIPDMLLFFPSETPQRMVIYRRKQPLADDSLDDISDENS